MRLLVLSPALLVGGVAFGADISLSFSGSCPGPHTVTVRGATPGGSVAIATGTNAGGSTIPSGGCAGTPIGIGGNRKLRTTQTADGAGMVNLTPNLPAGPCGQYAVAVDLSSCRVSEERQLTGAISNVASYDVGTGAEWTINPPTYSCPEACAANFGGVRSDWRCSPDPGNANGMAVATTWGSAKYCLPPGTSDDYDFSTGEAGYSCGGYGCAQSMWTRDNCFAGAGSINYCWQ